MSKKETSDNHELSERGEVGNDSKNKEIENKSWLFSLFRPKRLKKINVK
jgi:hypothetical protein